MDHVRMDKFFKCHKLTVPHSTAGKEHASRSEGVLEQKSVRYQPTLLGYGYNKTNQSHRSARSLATMNAGGQVVKVNELHSHTHARWGN